MSTLSNSERQQLIAKLAQLPTQVKALVQDLTPAQLTTHFLAGEWSVAQNVHHLADSHMNSYIRCKLMATEDHPTLKPYEQDAWAAFVDGQQADLADSLALLTTLHRRWVTFWENLPENAWARTGFHPASGVITLEDQLRIYVAHGEGHLDQMTRTLAGQ